jgi:hypothetical protein
MAGELVGRIVPFFHAEHRRTLIREFLRRSACGIMSSSREVTIWRGRRPARGPSKPPGRDQLTRSSPRPPVACRARACPSHVCDARAWSSRHVGRARAPPSTGAPSGRGAPSRPLGREPSPAMPASRSSRAPPRTGTIPRAESASQSPAVLPPLIASATHQCALFCRTSLAPAPDSPSSVRPVFGPAPVPITKPVNGDR